MKYHALLTLVAVLAVASCTSFFESLDSSPAAQKAGMVGDSVLIWALATNKIDPATASSFYATKQVVFDSSIPAEERQAIMLKTLGREAVNAGVINDADLILLESTRAIVLPDKVVAPDGKTVVPVQPAIEDDGMHLPAGPPLGLIRRSSAIEDAESYRPAPVFGNEPANGILAYTGSF